MWASLIGASKKEGFCVASRGEDFGCGIASGEEDFRVASNEEELWVASGGEDFVAASEEEGFVVASEWRALMVVAATKAGLFCASSEVEGFGRATKKLGSKFRRNSFRSRAQNLARTGISTETSILFRSFPEFLRSLMLSN
jgi:hypothetical protein